MQAAQRFWDKRARKYAARPIRNMAAYEQTMARTRAHLRTTDRVLEVGCGTGSTALLLADSVEQITASDYASAMIEIARESAGDQRIGNVRFIHADLFAGPDTAPAPDATIGNDDDTIGADDNAVQPASFDVVLAFNLLHLLADTPAAIRSISALLKPGGLFISKTVCLGENGGLWRLPLAIMRPLGLAPYVGFLTIEALETCVTDAHFEIVETGSFPASPPSRFIVARKR